MTTFGELRTSSPDMRMYGVRMVWPDGEWETLMFKRHYHAEAWLWMLSGADRPAEYAEVRSARLVRFSVGCQ